MYIHFLNSVNRILIPGVLLMSSLFAGSAFAGNGNGKVTNLLMHATADGNGVVMVSVEFQSNMAGCASANQWAIALKNIQGIAQYKLLLKAQSINKPVHIIGTNTCEDWSDRENVVYVQSIGW